ncbi:MAG TPA: flagellar basal body L-ring protein FlgH [bacterium]|jgi:flagellar L-ring protein precursor FlgH|nr:flagellar basal body L-ring protein FlgH [bacterium]
MNRFFIFVFVFAASMNSTQLVLADSLYPVEGSSSIYTEKRARRIGDVITVLIQENTNANQSAGSQYQKAGSVGIGGGSYVGGTGFGQTGLNSTNGIGVGASSSHQGQGTSSGSTTITGEMTAKIISVLPSGNYLVEGTRFVEVNEDKQTVEVTGEIRPDDISSDNTISSLRIANAKIKLTGSGPASETANPGILTRVLSWLGLF